MIILRFFSYLPFWLFYLIIDLVVFVLSKVLRYRKAIITENLKKSFPNKSEAEITQLRNEFYVNFCDTFLETLKILTISKAELNKRVTFKNIELVNQYLQNGKGVIAMMGHNANWELAAVALKLHLKNEVDCIYKPVTSQFFDKYMIAVRSHFGNNLLTMQEAPKQIISKKEEARLIITVADQTPMKHQITYWGEFLNQKTSFYTGSARMAYLTNYAVLFMKVIRQKRGFYEVTFELISEKVQEKNDLSIIDIFRKKLDQQINQYPSDWLWSHRRWKHQPDLNEVVRA